MRDTQFFEQALGLEKPWRVKAVKMDVAAKRVEIEVECGSGTAWAGGGQRLHVQGYEERQWRHLDTMQFETVIRARVPRVKYPDGRTEMVSVPWAERYARCTLLFERFAIEVFVACGHLRAGCELLGLDWSSGQRIMDRAVERGLLRREVEEVEQVGLDEKSFGRGQDYISVLSDLKRARVLEVRPGNDTQSGRALWQSMPEEQRARVQAAAMDMSAGFAAATRQDAPHVAIVYDKFHVSKLLNEAVDAVRRQEHRELGKEGESPLAGTRQLWLYNPLNLEDARLEEFAKVVERNLKTSRAWLAKETFQDFWQGQSRWQGEGYFRSWYGRAIRSRLEPVKKVARTLKAHLEGLLNYFKYPITNAVAEALNSRIQAIKANARGFRSFANYRTRILFYCGKLDMLPAS